MMKILTGTCHPELADLIAKSANVQLCETEITRFPDNEIFVKITENVRGADLFIVQSLSLNPNDMLMELLIMIDAAKRASADRITAVLPYYGYARQDRKDQPRVPITAKLVANVLVAAGANLLRHWSPNKKIEDMLQIKKYISSLEKGGFKVKKAILIYTK